MLAGLQDQPARNLTGPKKQCGDSAWNFHGISGKMSGWKKGEEFSQDVCLLFFCLNCFNERFWPKRLG